MPNIPPGRFNLSLPRLTLGTMTFGAQVDEPTARSMVDLCLERGINSIDTANVYCAGESERILGRILSGRRDKVILASKVGIKNGDEPIDTGLSPAAIHKAIDDSLRRLQTDHVDLYYLHQPDYSTPLEQSLATTNELVIAGKIKHIAASNYAAWQLCQMLWLAGKNGWQPIVAVQPMYNLLARRIEPELVPCCKEFNLGIIPYNPLAGGLLTGKHVQAAPIAGSRFDRMPLYRDRYWNDQNFAAVERLTEVARSTNRSLPQLAISWLLQQPTVTSIILGASQLAHLEENLDALSKPALPVEALAACDEVWASLRGVSPTYNR